MRQEGFRTHDDDIAIEVRHVDRMRLDVMCGSVFWRLPTADELWILGIRHIVDLKPVRTPGTVSVSTSFLDPLWNVNGTMQTARAAILTTLGKVMCHNKQLCSSMESGPHGRHTYKTTSRGYSCKTVTLFGQTRESTYHDTSKCKLDKPQ